MVGKSGHFERLTNHWNTNELHYSNITETARRNIGYLNSMQTKITVSRDQSFLHSRPIHGQVRLIKQLISLFKSMSTAAAAPNRRSIPRNLPMNASRPCFVDETWTLIQSYWLIVISPSLCRAFSLLLFHCSIGQCGALWRFDGGQRRDFCFRFNDVTSCFISCSFHCSCRS